MDEINPTSGRPFRGSGAVTPGGLSPNGAVPGGILAPDPKAPEPPKETPEAEKLRKLGPHLQRKVLEMLSRYPHYEGRNDARNRDYYAGDQWAPPIPVATPVAPAKVASHQNETFPIVDSLKATLLGEVPQVSFSDARQRSGANPPDRASDLDVRGRALAAVYNAQARLDAMGEALDAALLNSFIFDKGGIVQTSWDQATGRVVWESLNADEVFFDPVARRHRDVAWVFRLTHLFWDDFKALLEAGTYTLAYIPKTSWVQTVSSEGTAYPQMTSVSADTLDDPVLNYFRPEAAPPGEMSRLLEGPNEAADRRVFPDYIPMITWYDCRNKLCYHIHRGSGAIVGIFQVPLANPFRRFVPYPVPGRKDGASVVSLIAAQQRVINELVNGRLEVVRRIVPRLLLAKSLFQNDEDRERFLNSTAYEPNFVEPPEGGRPIQDHIGTTPPQPLSFDFNAQLADTISSMQKIAGTASYMRGTSENVRTAEEATMIRGAVENRLSKMNQKVIQFATELFEDARVYVKWAIHSPEVSNLDVAALAEISQADTTPDQLAAWLLEDTQQFQLLAFNPLMRDENTRRKMLAEGLPVLLGHPVIQQAFNLYELAREVAELWGIRLSTMNTPEEFQANLQAMSGQPALGQAPPGGAPPEAPPGAMPPEEEILAALLGGTPS